MTVVPPQAGDPTPRPRFISRVFWDLVWIWAVCALVAALLRIVAHDANLVLYVANSLTFYLYLPAYFVAPLSAWRRRWRLNLIAVFVMLCHLLWVLPDFRSATSVTDVVDRGARLRVFSANLYMKNENPQPLLAEIRAAGTDLLLLQEYSSRWEQALADSGIAAEYPHFVGRVREDSFGTAVYSRRPFASESVWYTGEVPVVTVTLEIDGALVRVVNWHSLPPRRFEYFRVLNRQYAELIEHVGQSQAPTLVMGDFNGTQHAYWLQRLKSLGFRSAHEQVGRGYAVTYPNGTGRLPPIRIDHALMSRGIHCANIAEGRGAGSDHKPLLAEFVMRPGTSNPKR